MRCGRRVILMGFLVATLSACAGVGRGRKVLVLGAGVAGLAAARELAAEGFAVTLIEARDRVGGRVVTDKRWAGVPVDLGASWIHGVTGNPIAEIAADHGIKLAPITNYDNKRVYGPDGVVVDADTLGSEVEALAAAVAGEQDRRRDAGEADISLADFVATRTGGLDEPARRRLDYIVNSEYEHEYAADAEALSLLWFDDGEEKDGGDALIPGGYGQIVDVLAADLHVELSQVVTAVEYGADGVVIRTASGRTFAGEFAVITLPLGVLKRGSVRFTPALPTAKTAAIARLGMGLLDKCYLRFEARFWGEGSELLGHIDAATKGRWAEFVDLTSVLGAPVLLAFNAGAHAETVAARSDAEVVADVMAVLRSIFGAEVPEPQDVILTRWGEDPFAGGSYSSLAPGATPDDLEVLAAAVAGRLFFAGEATSGEYQGTVHGAYLSGVRAAKEMIDEL